MERQYGSIEHAKDCANPTSPIDGVLILLTAGGKFQLRWIPYSTESLCEISYFLLNSETLPPSSWEPGEAFTLNLSDLKSFVLTENPLGFFVYSPNSPRPRKFIIDTDKFTTLTSFVEQLIVLQIAAPSIESPFTLEFFERDPLTPKQLPLFYFNFPREPYESLDVFWDKFQVYFEKFMIHNHKCGLIPRNYPLSSSAQALHQRTMAKIKQFTDGIEHVDPLTSEIFDADGRIIDSDKFMEKVFYGGIADDAKKLLIPFIFGLYPLDSTATDRELIDKDMEQQYATLEASLHDITQEQLAGNVRRNKAFKVICQDVARTDRNHEIFRQPDSPGQIMLTELLKAYVLYNPDISYLQGMNDMFVPFILAFFPELKHIVFFCFVKLIEKTDHWKLLRDVTAQCGCIVDDIFKLLEKASPMVSVWLTENSLQKILWLYSDLVLIFKRTFENIWPIWVRFLSSPSPKIWLTYFSAALILATFDQFASIPGVNISIMMDKFPKLIQNVDPEEINRIALWIYKEHPLPCIETPYQKPSQQASFDFFEANCSTPEN